MMDPQGPATLNQAQPGPPLGLGLINSNLHPPFHFEHQAHFFIFILFSLLFICFTLFSNSFLIITIKSGKL